MSGKKKAFLAPYKSSTAGSGGDDGGASKA